MRRLPADEYVRALADDRLSRDDLITALYVAGEKRSTEQLGRLSTRTLRELWEQRVASVND